MSEKKTKDQDPMDDEKIEQHKKSIEASKKKQDVSKTKQKEKTADSKDDDWNDPTGNSHLGKTS